MTAENWRDVVRVEPREDQKRFVASVAYYLNLCRYEEDWRPLALYQDGEVVGFAMWGYDAEEEAHWIGGLVVGAEHQGRGYGQAAMEALLGHLAAQPEYRQAALSPTNRRTPSRVGFAPASGSSRPARGWTAS